MRFIPARAGNSRVAKLICCPIAVHPRACGEQLVKARVESVSCGSSPRVRGTGLLRIVYDPPIRFIPARAGNRPRRGGSGFCRPVHPRACGEQEIVALAKSGSPGSSPRVRGTVYTIQSGFCKVRFIPRVRGTAHIDQVPYSTFRFIPARAGNSLPADHCSTEVFTISKRVPPFYRVFPIFGRGANATSFNPSKSIGIRRFLPTVTKS